MSIIRAGMMDIPRVMGDMSAMRAIIRAVIAGITTMVWNRCAMMRGSAR
jgi:hypothetical protein